MINTRNIPTEKTCDSCREPLKLIETTAPIWKRTKYGFTKDRDRVRWVYTCTGCDYEYVTRSGLSPRTYWQTPHNSHK